MGYSRRYSRDGGDIMRISSRAVLVIDFLLQGCAAVASAAADVSIPR